MTSLKAPITIALLLTAGATQAQWSESWTQPHDPFRIADNLYDVGSADLTSFLITSAKGHADAPMAELLAQPSCSTSNSADRLPSSSGSRPRE